MGDFTSGFGPIGTNEPTKCLSVCDMFDHFDSILTPYHHYSYLLNINIGSWPFQSTHRAKTSHAPFFSMILPRERQRLWQVDTSRQLGGTKMHTCSQMYTGRQPKLSWLIVSISQMINKYIINHCYCNLGCPACFSWFIYLPISGKRFKVMTCNDHQLPINSLSESQHL